MAGVRGFFRYFGYGSALGTAAFGALTAGAEGNLISLVGAALAFVWLCRMWREVMG